MNENRWKEYPSCQCCEFRQRIGTGLNNPRIYPCLHVIEKHIIDPNEGYRMGHRDANIAWFRDQREGCPSSYAFYDGRLYVIWSQGQGPGLGYAEQWYNEDGTKRDFKKERAEREGRRIPLL